jgi:non-lysosomal glucosylceramidase
MDGWFRTYTHDSQGALNQGNHNEFRSQQAGASQTMKGIVFGRNRAEESANEWDGEFSIAALETPGVEVSYQTEFLADGDGKAIWSPLFQGRKVGEQLHFLGECQRKTGRGRGDSLHAAARRKENRSYGHRLGFSGGGIWSGT